MTFKNTAKIVTILILVATAYGVMAASDCRPVVGVSCPGIDTTVQYILNLVNTESGAKQSLQGVEKKWTYSMAPADPCTLLLTEELQTVNTAAGSSPATPVRKITHYLIPVADLNLGKFGTRLKLEPGVM